MADPKDKDTQLKNGVDDPKPQDDDLTPETDKETLKKLGYKSWDEVGKALSELRTKLGTQGSDLGDVRKSNKEMTAMLEKANQVIQGLVDEKPEDYQPPTDTQKAGFMQRFYSDPLRTMSEVAAGTVTKELEKLNKQLDTLAGKLQRIDVIEGSPKVKDLPPALQSAIVQDKTGKMAAEIEKILDDAGKLKVEAEKRIAEDKKKATELAAKKKIPVLTPSPEVKQIDSEEDYEKEIQDAIKTGNTEKASRLVASRLGEQ